MKAVVYAEYGPPDVLQLKEVEKLVPKAGEVLVKVRAASVNAADWRMMRADPFLVRFYSGLFRPKRITTLGGDIAGVVEAVGPDVTRFSPGDEVFGEVFASNFGGFAEYKCAFESELLIKPAHVSFEAAAAVPLAGMAALQGLRDVGRIRAGQKVLINGASGGVGTFAVQLAKHFGAEVFAVCGTKKVDQARALGADHVIDYTQQDFTRSGEKYDLIVAVHGSHSIFDYRCALLPQGRYVMIGGGGKQLFQALLLGPLLSFGGIKMAALSSKPNLQDLQFLKELVEAGKLKPVIDKCFTLDHAADAIRYVEQGHASGKVVVTMGS